MSTPRFAHGLALDHTEDEFRDHSAAALGHEQQGAKHSEDATATQVPNGLTFVPTFWVQTPDGSWVTISRDKPRPSGRGRTSSEASTQPFLRIPMDLSRT